MKQLLQWIMGMLHKMQPKQSASGEGTVQVERAGGDVQIDNSRPVTMHVTQVFYSAQVESAPAANVRPPATVVSNEQREVLMLISRLPHRGEAVFRFMEREFKTRMVRDLKPSELVRVRAYVATINKRLAS